MSTNNVQKGSLPRLTMAEALALLEVAMNAALASEDYRAEVAQREAGK